MRSSASPEFTISPSSSRILVVDDEETILKSLTAALTQEGYCVLTAENGWRALELLHAAQTSESEIDLMILDLMLPGLNGLDLCRLLRQKGNLIPVLILSARNSETDIVLGLEAGADDYLTKPFSIRELIARCRALLRQRSQLQPKRPTLQYQEITLFLQEYRVTIEERDINLSPKEFSLLELLMRHPRKVFSREQLLEQIWGMRYLGDPKTVDVHIRWLREKIEPNPSTPRYIITVRGFGYRLS